MDNRSCLCQHLFPSTPTRGWPWHNCLFVVVHAPFLTSFSPLHPSSLSCIPTLWLFSHKPSIYSIIVNHAYPFFPNVQLILVDRGLFFLFLLWKFSDIISVHLFHAHIHTSLHSKCTLQVLPFKSITLTSENQNFRG